MPTIGRFLGGIAALIYRTEDERYLLLRRSTAKDFSSGVWECVTGRVDQGEGFEQALHREVGEELGVQVEVELILGTTHFHRGAPTAENELIGMVCLCRLASPADQIQISPEHDMLRWVTIGEAQELLSASDASTIWIGRLLLRAELLRRLAPPELLQAYRQVGIELG